MLLRKVSLLIFFLLGVKVAFGQFYLNYGKTLRLALNRLENNYVYIITYDSNIYAGKLYILDNFGNPYYVISNSNDKKKEKFYLKDILDIDRLPKEQNVSYDKMIFLFENQTYAKNYVNSKITTQDAAALKLNQNVYIPNPSDNPKIQELNFTQNKTEYQETFSGFNKAIYSYTAFPIDGDMYLYFNVPNGIQFGAKVFKNIELEGGVNTSPFYNGAGSFFIQPKLVTNFNANFNLSYIVNINRLFSLLINVPDYNHFHIINFMAGNYKNWINFGLGSSITNKNQIIYSVSSGLKIFESTYLIFDAYRFNYFTEHIGINFRFSKNRGHFDFGFSAGNRIEEAFLFLDNSSFRTKTFLKDDTYSINIGYVYRINFSE